LPNWDVARQMLSPVSFTQLLSALGGEIAEKVNLLTR
jgi:hypothetical protein